MSRFGSPRAPDVGRDVAARMLTATAAVACALRPDAAVVRPRPGGYAGEIRERASGGRARAPLRPTRVPRTLVLLACSAVGTTPRRVTGTPFGRSRCVRSS